MTDIAKVARTVPDEEFFPMPREVLFMNRLQFGFYSVLARLDVEADYAAVEAAFLLPFRPDAVKTGSPAGRDRAG
jgi:hypothetical protein